MAIADGFAATPQRRYDLGNTGFRRTASTSDFVERVHHSF